MQIVFLQPYKSTVDCLFYINCCYAEAYMLATYGAISCSCLDWQL